MKNQKLGILLLLSSSLTFAQNKDTYEKTISPDDLKKHLTIISSDDMQGRDTGSEGQKKAGEYIVKQFKEYGLQPIVKTDNGELSYYQKFNLYKSGWKDAYVKINNTKKVFFKDYFPVGMVNIPEEKEIETVFVGYGIKAESRNDYSGKSIEGKAVIFMEGAPNNMEKPEEWEGSVGSKKKQKIAAELGAAFIFEVSNAESDQFKTLNAERKAILSRFNRMALEKSNAEKTTPSPAFVISKNMAADMIGISEKNLLKYLEGKKIKFPKDKTNISVKSERGQDLVETANIMGFIEGTDKKDEVVVLTAHYDHVGIDDKGQIYNGADDDGSGTCAILELAQAYSIAKANGHGPRRSILFMTVTGEEKGLLGSKYYTDVAPVIPLDKTIVDLNIDMIGRVDKKHESNPNYVYVIGSDKLSSELHRISEDANKNSINFELDYEFNSPTDPNKFYYRSDHYNFAKNKIPVIFYFTGVHEDYHKPGDDVEKILFEKYSSIVKLVFNTSWELANRDNKIVVDSNKP
jgi:hypothetical protein